MIRVQSLRVILTKLRLRVNYALFTNQMFPGISNSFGLGGRERGVPEVYCWKLDLYDN